jgi:protein-S-isoprenylcysteine O-methyltransferase Ste14
VVLPDELRHVIALFLVAFAPASVLFWVVVHPLATFWRRLGHRWGYAAGYGLAIVLVAIVFRYRTWIVSTDLGGRATTTLAGFACLVAATIGRRKLQEQLTTRVMLGLPELAPDKYPGKLLTGGVYAHVRHPRYLQMLVAVLGWALLANHAAGYLAVLLVVAALAVVIPLEEREPAARFGAEYESYRQRVPALFPQWRTRGL